MELRHLRYFVAVAEEQNVTRAAARLHVSQPPLTRQIQDLESELGVDLFTRTARSIQLTRAGKLFLKEARGILDLVEAATEKVRHAHGEGRPELQIGYAPSPTVEFLPAILRAFHKQQPGVRVTLHDCSSPEMLAGLRSGKLHAAFMVSPCPRLAKGLGFAKIQTYPMAIAVPPGHPFARRREVTVAEVLREPLVAYSRSDYPDYHAQLEELLGRTGRRLRFAEECDSGTSLIAAVESGKGVAFSSASMAHQAGKRLRLIPLRPAPEPMVVGVAWRPEESSTLLPGLLKAAAAWASRNAAT